MNTSFVPKALPSLPLLHRRAPFISTKASSQEKSHKSSIPQLKRTARPQGYLVRSLAMHFCKRLFSWLESVASRSHASKCINLKAIESLASSKSLLAIQVGTLLATVGAEPALAVTGVNNEEDLVWVLIQLAISAFFYFLVAPPIIMTWLRKRWYKRDLLEMYLQFMFVFIFFPGVLLWAPFLNFRKFPRDPSMKYPWSTPENPSQIKNAYRKYPWATEEDYEVQ